MHPSPCGALVIDKPRGLTSHDAVAAARRALGTPRVGHTGTLDPLATGVLVLVAGRATRLAQFVVGEDKEYLADIRLGLATPTYDAEGLPAAAARTPAAGAPGPDAVGAVLNAFRGTFLQTPPPFSAKKVGGRRAYEHARRQQTVTLEPVRVTVTSLEQLASDDPMLLRLRVAVTSGFYVRSLAHDIGVRLECGAHLEALRRTRVGALTLADAVPLDALHGPAPAIIDPNRLLQHMSAVRLSDEGARRIAHGSAVGPEHVVVDEIVEGSGARVRLVAPSGALLAVADRRPDGLLHPLVVLV